MKKATTSEAAAAAKPAKAAPAKRATGNSTPAVAATPPAAPVVSKPATNAAAPKNAVEVTSVLAQIDVGFGNVLFIRGEGPGLSWDRGVPMECATPETWKWSTTAASRPFAYKVLINDEQWSAGSDLVAANGKTNAVSPAF